MTLSRKLLAVLTLFILLSGCNSKKKPSLAGDDPVEMSDFMDFFPKAGLPFEITNEVLQRKEKDSLLISYKVFTQFVPDTVLGKMFQKTKPKLYPLGKVEGKNETYLFAKGVAGTNKTAFIIAFDKKNAFMDVLPALRNEVVKDLQRQVVMDKRHSINFVQTRKNKDGSISEGKDVYILNTDGRQFMLIMTDAIEDKPTELLNPIDTLSRKHKLTGDYATGKMNLVSIRDSRRADRLSFFIHFEKNNGDCTGELKGEAIIKSATLAEYRQGGDPCILQFKFNTSGSSVTLKEIDGCGSHRGLRCSFDGSYPRKKEVKPKKKK
jgi:hypothetical protein